VAAALGRAGIEASGLRLAYLMMRAELAAVVVNGAMRGKQHTYAWADLRIGPATDLDLEQALVRLVEGYVAARGPVTVDDLVWWSSLTVGQVRRGLAACGDAVEAREIDGTAYWVSTVAPRRSRARPWRAHLLQGYDEYVISYRASRGLTNLDGLVIAPPGTNRTVQPVVLDTQVVGEWLRTTTRETVDVEVRLARSLTGPELVEIELAAGRYAEFVGRRLRLTIG
jgi:hypothetical protein